MWPVSVFFLKKVYIYIYIYIYNGTYTPGSLERNNYMATILKKNNLDLFLNPLWWNIIIFRLSKYIFIFFSISYLICWLKMPPPITYNKKSEYFSKNY